MNKKYLFFLELLQKNKTKKISLLKKKLNNIF